MQFIERMKEPSSWAGIGILWAIVGPHWLPWEIVTQAGAAVCGLLALVLREAK